MTCRLRTKYTGFFHNISLNAAPIISVVYWIVVFGKELQKNSSITITYKKKPSRTENFLISLRSTIKKRVKFC